MMLVLASMTLTAQTGSHKKVVVAPKAPEVSPEDQLSADLKQTLLASADPTSTTADVRVYIRTARVQIRTKKDREVFDKLVRYVELLDDADKQDAYLHSVTYAFEDCAEYAAMDSENPNFDKSLTTLDIPLSEEESINKTVANAKAVFSAVHSKLTGDTGGTQGYAIRHAECNVEHALNLLTAKNEGEARQQAKEDRSSAKLLYAEFRSDLGLPAPTIPAPAGDLQ